MGSRDFLSPQTRMLLAEADEFLDEELRGLPRTPPRRAASIPAVHVGLALVSKVEDLEVSLESLNVEAVRLREAVGSLQRECDIKTERIEELTWALSEAQAAATEQSASFSARERELQEQLREECLARQALEQSLDEARKERSQVLDLVGARVLFPERDECLGRKGGPRKWSLRSPSFRVGDPTPTPDPVEERSTHLTPEGHSPSTVSLSPCSSQLSIGSPLSEPGWDFRTKDLSPLDILIVALQDIYHRLVGL
jgi:chaperonin cofactor prefoldin